MWQSYFESENFTYAEGWDSSGDRYLRLKAGEYVTPTLSSQSLLAKSGGIQNRDSSPYPVKEFGGNVVRTVTENCRVLKFNQQEFEFE